MRSVSSWEIEYYRSCVNWRARMREMDRMPRVRKLRYLLALSLGLYAAFTLGYVPAALPTPSTPTTLELPAYQIPTADEAWFTMDADLLANMARGEDPKAVEAVTWVALNRAGCEAAPDFLRCERPIAEVVTEGRAFGTMKNGVFIPSWTRDWDDPEVEGRVQAILYGYVPDPTGGSTHFHRRGTWTPPWAPKPQAWQQFGSHWFYKEAKF